MALAFIARWFVRPERKAEFAAALQELAENIPPSVYATAAYVNLTWNRRGEFIACESWNDEDALNELRSSPAFHAAMRKMTACCSKPLELEVLDDLEGDCNVFQRYPAGRADPRYYPELAEMSSRFV